MSGIDDDCVSNFSNNPTMEQILEARLSRRRLLAGGATATAVAASLGGVGTLLTAVPAEATAAGYGGVRKHRPELGFKGISPAASSAGIFGTPGDEFDTIRVPEGYTARVLIAWGDPVSDGPAFKQDGSNTWQDQERQWGMHNDGLVYFPLLGSSHGLLVQNHEYTDDVLLFPDGTANWNVDKTKKSQAAHGVGIIEVRRRDDGVWEVVRPSYFARRITAYTRIRIAGPAARDPRLMTSADPTGEWVLGTINNCAMGYTPWGTYLACEENFNGYFRKDGARTAEEQRYGIGSSPSYRWHETDTRFNANVEPNEPNRFGYVTEIYPYLPTSTPVKRTALGRLKHEGAWVQEARDGRVVVYTGDDEINEYIYRYISRLPWRASFARGIHPLDDGTLYVARFDEDGTGRWIPLTPHTPELGGWTIADILINTRGAADLVGATKMDRPEWIDTFPAQLTAIATLTNNSNRAAAATATAPAGPPVDAANPRAANRYGQIIQWSYKRDWTEPTFKWELFALCGDPVATATSTPTQTSPASNIVGDKYGSPDGIYVDPAGLLWIQTDVSGNTINTGPYAGFGNNQMLAADPVTRETRRFLTGPYVCEITGVFMTPDRTTMFVGVQHPGEAPSGSNDPANPKRYSNWPDGAAGSRPRSALLVITKDDGGPIGT
jgi:secreted PhoX family phosphatase